MHMLHTVRNLLSVAPIAFTWWALNLAATAYDKDLSDPRYHDDLYQPFLRLWQDGFHGNHGFVIPFSGAAGMDALILTGLILLVVGIPWYEKGRRKAIRASLGSFDAVIDDLLAAIGKDGANAHLADSDIQKLSQGIQESIERTLGKLLLNYDRVAEEARKFVEDTHQRTTVLVKNFDDDLIIFNSDVKLLSNDVQKINGDLNSYGQRLQELTDASNRLAGSSNDLALNAKTMAESATLNSQASQGIGTQLGALNTTQQEIVKAQKDVIQELASTQRQVVQDVTTSQQTVVQKIADSQKEVVNQLTGAADVVATSGQNTRDAAKELDRVASGLEQLTRADFQAMTDGVKQANQDLVNEVRKTAGGVQQVFGGLSQVDAQLQLTTKAQATTAQSLGSTTGTAKPFAGKVVYSAAFIAAAAVIGELVVLIMHSH
jgi:hypothetical protein